MRATICVVALIVRKPVSVLIATGQIVASVTMKMIERSLKPNQMIASGKIAIAGNGLSTAVSTASTSRPTAEKTANDANAKPINAPIASPLNSVCSVCSVPSGIFPLSTSVHSCFATSTGEATSSGETCESETYACQIPIRTTSTIA